MRCLILLALLSTAAALPFGFRDTPTVPDLVDDPCEVKTPDPCVSTRTLCLKRPTCLRRSYTCRTVSQPCQRKIYNPCCTRTVNPCFTRTPCQTRTISQSCFKTRTPCYQARTPCYQTRTPCFQARTPCFQTRTPCYQTRTPCLPIRAPCLPIRRPCLPIRTPCITTKIPCEPTKDVDPCEPILDEPCNELEFPTLASVPCQKFASASASATVGGGF